MQAAETYLRSLRLRRQEITQYLVSSKYRERYLTRNWALYTGWQRCWRDTPPVLCSMAFSLSLKKETMHYTGLMSQELN
jgi:hypothetical protein